MVASTSPTAPLIVVFGATGTQGGSVIDHLVSSAQPYRIRAVTRDPAKPSGKKLEDKGCQVVKAEMGNAEEVKNAIEGSEIVFVRRALRLCYHADTPHRRASPTFGNSPPSSSRMHRTDPPPRLGNTARKRKSQTGKSSSEPSRPTCPPSRPLSGPASNPPARSHTASTQRSSTLIPRCVHPSTTEGALTGFS